MTSAMFEIGQQVLVAAKPDDPPWRMGVDLVQQGQITLASHDNEALPGEWKDIDEVHITSLGRFSVYLIHVPVIRAGDTRLVIGEPTAQTPVQRRAYVRVSVPVPASYLLHDPANNTWTPFEGEARDVGGGGCSVLTDVVPDAGAVVVISFAIDDAPLVIIGKVLPRDDLPTIGRPMTRLEFAVIRESDRDRVLRFLLLTLAGRRNAELRAKTPTLQRP